jgi:hypothetical protein
MGRLLFLATVLFSSGAFAVCPVVTVGGEEHRTCDEIFDGDVTFNGAVNIPGGVTDPSAVKKTTAAVTLYVRSGGDDGNDCLSAGMACATPQGAVDKIPEYVDHQVVVDIGAGTFGGVFIHERVVSSRTTSVNITVRGAMAGSTLATGTNSGTATGGTMYQLTDSGQSWTVNDLQGRFVKSSGYYYLVQSNTATTIDVVGVNWYNFNGLAYTIEEPSTVLSVVSGSAADVRNTTKGGWYSITLSQVELASTNGMGFYGLGVDDMYLNVVKVTSTGNRGMQFSGGGSFMGYEVDVYDSAYDGIMVNDTVNVYCAACAVRSGGDGTEAAVWYLNANYVGGDRLFVDSFSGNGVVIDNCQEVEPYKYTINNVSKDGVVVTNSFVVKGGFSDSNTFVGTGNTQFGVRVGPRSNFVFDSATTLTGTSGNLSMTGGATVLTWTTDFPADGDVFVNVERLNRVERDD